MSSDSFSLLYFTPDSAGYSELMSRSVTGGVLDGHAATVCSRANSAAKRGTYTVGSAHVVGDRQTAFVRTGDYEARIDTAKRNTLGKAIS